MGRPDAQLQTAATAARSPEAGSPISFARDAISFAQDEGVVPWSEREKEEEAEEAERMRLARGLQSPVAHVHEPPAVQPAPPSQRLRRRFG